MAAKGYDFVIVGGGSAGCVLAARLSENPQAQVCLIEAGGSDRHPLYRAPAGFAKMTKGIGSWGWSTVPQMHLEDRVLWFTQAKVIGGGSTVNAQIYTRGHALDYDEWRQLGCDGWGYEDVLPYFRRSEDNDTFDDRFHGTGGPLGVSQPAAPLPICEAFFRAAEALGIPQNPDMSGAQQEGVGFYQLTQARSERCSTATAFLKPARARKNLEVRLNTEVRHLVLQNGRVTAVAVQDGAGEEIIYAGSEVVLCAGAIGTPRFLMLSGIGPGDHLSEVGISVHLDQPEIGANLQDHLDLFAIAECTGDHTYDKYARPFWSAVAGARYLMTRGGPVASSLFETGGFWYAEEGARSPDIQFHLGLGSGIEAGVAKMENAGVTLNSAYLRPRSRGVVRLASSDPQVAPLIDPNYWAEAHDRRMAIRGLKLAQEIMRQAPLAPYIKREVLPGPDVQSEADYATYAARHAKTDHHPAGTCRMGNDAAAVVTPRLAVNGIDGLRIADASVMPRLVSSNTNAATIMIAEKAAEMIRVDHGLS